MERVPITFEWKGRIYRGEFMPVTAGGHLCYLLVDNRFQGQLSYQPTGWQWRPHNPETFKGMDDYFGTTSPPGSGERISRYHIARV